MKNIKSTTKVYLVALFVGITALFYIQAKQPVDYESLKRYAKELEEAFRAKIDLDESTTPEKEKIDEKTIEKIKNNLKEPLLDLLATTKFTTDEELKEKVEKAEIALKGFKEELGVIHKQEMVKPEKSKKIPASMPGVLPKTSEKLPTTSMVSKPKIPTPGMPTKITPIVKPLTPTASPKPITIPPKPIIIPKPPVKPVIIPKPAMKPPVATPPVTTPKTKTAPTFPSIKPPVTTPPVTTFPSIKPPVTTPPMTPPTQTTSPDSEETFNVEEDEEDNEEDDYYNPDEEDMIK